MVVRPKKKGKKKKSKVSLFFSPSINTHRPEPASQGLCHPKALSLFYFFLNLSDLFRESIFNNM